MGAIAFGAFSALRAYALSDRKIWLAGVIILLALPPPMINMFQGSKSQFENLASPFNCSISSSLSPALSIRVNLVSRASQLATELLVVTITWWYNYQSSHVWKDSLKLRQSLSSLLIYNGSIYFLFFASWYVLDIVLNVAPVPPKVLFVDELLVSIFYDPITSILVCRFILSLRQFHSRTTSATYNCSEMRFSCVAEHLVTAPVSASDFAAQPGDSGLPGFVASFSHPVHVDHMDCFETDGHESGSDLDVIADGRYEWQLERGDERTGWHRPGRP